MNAFDDVIAMVDLLHPREVHPILLEPGRWRVAGAPGLEIHAAGASFRLVFTPTEKQHHEKHAP